MRRIRARSSARCSALMSRSRTTTRGAIESPTTTRSLTTIRSWLCARSGRLACATRGATASTTGREAARPLSSSVTSDRTRERRSTSSRPAPAAATTAGEFAKDGRPTTRARRRRFFRSASRFSITPDAGRIGHRGLIYRGAALEPSFNGRYFFGDFVSGRVFSIGLHVDPAGEATADDSREHTEALGGRSRLGAVSSFGADHAGELLLLNYSAGTLLRVTPDFTLVPFAPTLTAAPDGDSVSLEWRPRTDGVSAAGYAVERVRNNAVTERVLIERTDVATHVERGRLLPGPQPSRQRPVRSTLAAGLLFNAVNPIRIQRFAMLI